MAFQVNENTMEMRVSKSTNVGKLSTSITCVIREGKKVQLVAIGANAVNQAIKACAKATGMLAGCGHFVAWKTFFIDRMVDPKTKDQPIEPVEDLVVGDLTEEHPTEEAAPVQEEISAIVLESVTI